MLAAGALAGLAAAVGATLSIARQKREAERLFPPSGRFMRAGGVRLHYSDTEGPGQQVVLLHGNGAMIADMAISGLITEVSKRHRTIVFDRPGYGFSERPRGVLWDARQQAKLLMTALKEQG